MRYIVTKSASKTSEIMPSRRLKFIQIFNRYLKKGGEEKSVDRIYHALKSKFEIKRMIISSGIWKNQNDPSTAQQAFMLWHNAEILRRLRRLHDEFKPDFWLCHNYLPIFSLNLLALARELRVPIVQYAHNYKPYSISGVLWANDEFCPDGINGNVLPEVIAGTWQNSRIKSAVLAINYKLAEKLGYFNSVRAWVGISDFVKNSLQNWGIPQDRVLALRHSWDIINQKPRQNSQARNYLLLGRLQTEKGVQCALDAWRIVEKKLGENAPKLIICGVGELEKIVADTAEKSNRIEWRGFVDGEEKRQLCESAKAFLAPSLWHEPLGLVSYEAYDYGKAMLAANSGGLAETVSHGVSGYLHELGNATQLAEQIINLEKNPKLALTFGANGRRWLEENTKPKLWRERFENFIYKNIDTWQAEMISGKAPTYRIPPKKRQTLIFAHIPPPAHGQSIMLANFIKKIAACGTLHTDKFFLKTLHSLSQKNSSESKLARNSLAFYDKKYSPAVLFTKNSKVNHEPMQFHHINARFSRDHRDIGRVNLQKTLMLFKYCTTTLWKRVKHRVQSLYYIPAPPRRAALYRDIAIMFFLRPFFPRLILHWHATGLGEWLRTKAFFFERYLAILLLGRADVAIALNDVCAKDFKILCPRRKILVPNGIEDPAPDFAQKILPARNARLQVRTEEKQNATFNLLFMSHCVREKGVFTCLEATALLQKKLSAESTKTRLFLNVAGEFFHEGEEHEFMRRAAELFTEPERHLRYHGFISGVEKDKLLRESDCMLLPSVFPYETQPVCLIEALAYGLPTVATRWRGLPELVVEQCGALIMTQDVDELVEALEKLIFCGNFEAARQKYLAKFTIEKYAEKLRRILAAED